MQVSLLKSTVKLASKSSRKGGIPKFKHLNGLETSKVSKALNSAEGQN